VRKPSLFIPSARCEHCGQYNHNVPLIPGITIQCINGDENQFHLIDYFLKPDECASVVNLCERNVKNVVQNFVFNGYWKKICSKLYNACI